MIGWIILASIAGLILLIAVLMLFSITANVEYNDDFYIKAGYLFIPLYNSKKAKKKKKKKAKLKKKPDKKSLVSRMAENSGIERLKSDVSKGNSIGFDFELFKIIYDSAKLPVKRLIQKLRVYNLSVICVIAGDDAAKVALSYGLQSALTSGFLAWMNEILTLRVKEVSITADFSKDETETHLKFRIKLKLGTAVIFLISYILNTVKNNENSKKRKKVKTTTEES